MKSPSLALSSPPPGPAGAEPLPVGPRRRRARPAPARSRSASAAIRDALEIAGETLWVVLLFLVIAFLVAKAPQIDAAIDEISGSRAPASAMDASRELQIRDLESRFARYESKLAPLEHGYVQLKQRHADLLKAYAELRKSRVREAYAPAAESRPAGAP